MSPTSLERSLSESDSHDLYPTHSERSIDEAIQERSQGTLSPTSPTHLLQGKNVMYVTLMRVHSV